MQKSIKRLNAYAMSLGESVSSGPFFKAYLANLLPGQFVQPFIDAAFSDLGLDPHVLSPSQRLDPQTGQPGTPALPMPFPRTGQGGEPNLHLPDAITGNPGDPRYPYREPLPAPPPGGPPPGPPATIPPEPTTEPLHVPAPNEPAPSAPTPGGPGARPGADADRPRWPVMNSTDRPDRAGHGAGGVADRRCRRGGPSVTGANRTTVVAYFANSNGIFVGDEVRILGVAVGKITKIEPQPERAKITFWYDDKYKVPADVKAVILSPSLVTARAIQLTPAYTSGAVLQPTTPSFRWNVPRCRWNATNSASNCRSSLNRCNPPSPAGSARSERSSTPPPTICAGRAPTSATRSSSCPQAFSALGDHSNDIFSTVKNLSILVSALQDSTDLMRQLNVNLAAVTGLLSNGSR